MSKVISPHTTGTLRQRIGNTYSCNGIPPCGIGTWLHTQPIRIILRKVPTRTGQYTLTCRRIPIVIERRITHSNTCLRRIIGESMCSRTRRLTLADTRRHIPVEITRTRRNTCLIQPISVGLRGEGAGRNTQSGVACGVGVGYSWVCWTVFGFDTEEVGLVPEGGDRSRRANAHAQGELAVGVGSHGGGQAVAQAQAAGVLAVGGFIASRYADVDAGVSEVGGEAFGYACL